MGILGYLGTFVLSVVGIIVFLVMCLYWFNAWLDESSRKRLIEKIIQNERDELYLAQQLAEIRQRAGFSSQRPMGLIEEMFENLFGDKTSPYQSPQYRRHEPSSNKPAETIIDVEFREVPNHERFR